MKGFFLLAVFVIGFLSSGLEGKGEVDLWPNATAYYKFARNISKLIILISFPLANYL